MYRQNWRKENFLLREKGGGERNFKGTAMRFAIANALIIRGRVDDDVSFLDRDINFLTG